MRCSVGARFTAKFPPIESPELATELMFAPRAEGEDPRHVDSIWPIWNVLDMTPGGRGSDPDYPAIQYE